MKRTRYLVEVRFRADGTDDILSRIVSSHKIARDQLQFDREWCDKHRHVIISEKIEEVVK